MKVRVFLPADDKLEQSPFGQFKFDAMPLAGQILRFTDLRDADYPIKQVGFIQDGESFTGAVWLGPAQPRGGSPERAAELGEEIAS